MWDEAREIVISQLMDHLPFYEFQKCVESNGGDAHIWEAENRIAATIKLKLRITLKVGIGLQTCYPIWTAARRMAQVQSERGSYGALQISALARLLLPHWDWRPRVV